MFRRDLQRRLHFVRRQVRTRLQQQRRCTSRHRRRHARTREPHVGAAVGTTHSTVRQLTPQPRIRRHGRHDRIARRHYVRLHQGIGRKVTRRRRRGRAGIHHRTHRAVRRHFVVITRHSALGVQRANRQRARREARRHNGAHHRDAVRRLAEVAGRGDNKNARRHRTLNRLRQRIVGILLRRRTPQREVDDLHAPKELLVAHEPVNRFDDVRHIPGPVITQHLDADQFSARRHADIGRLRAATLIVVVIARARTAAGNDALHVSAMAVGVTTTPPHAFTVGEVQLRPHAVTQVRMVRSAGIEHRNANTTTGQATKRRAVPRPHLVGTSGRGRHGHHRKHPAVLGQRPNVLVVAEVENLRRRAHKDATDDQAAHQPQAVLLAQSINLGLRGRQDHLDQLLRRAVRFEFPAQLRRHPRSSTGRFGRRRSQKPGRHDQAKNAGQETRHSTGSDEMVSAHKKLSRHKISLVPYQPICCGHATI